MTQRIGIVGAGIVGLAHAWAAAERGHAVTEFERSPLACRASIRNFGMIWLVGQPVEIFGWALASRQRWLRLAEESGIWVHPCGSLLLAHRADEWEVLTEFFELKAQAALGPHLALLEREAALERSPAINPQGFLGGLHCNLDLCVDPSRAIRAIPKFLEDRYQVEFQLGGGRCWQRPASNRARSVLSLRSNHHLLRARYANVVSGADRATGFAIMQTSDDAHGCTTRRLAAGAASGGWPEPAA